MANPDKTNADEQDARTISPVERSIVTIAALLIAGLIGFLLYQAITDHGGKPLFALAVETIDESRPGYVDVVVRNQGQGAASDVEIEGTHTEENGKEVSTARLDYSPARSELSVTLIFSGPVSADALSLRVTGYSDP